MVPFFPTWPYIHLGRQLTGCLGKVICNPSVSEAGISWILRSFNNAFAQDNMQHVRVRHAVLGGRMFCGPSAAKTRLTRQLYVATVPVTSVPGRCPACSLLLWHFEFYPWTTQSVFPLLLGSY
jgi:hypothetical protein